MVVPIGQMVWLEDRVVTDGSFKSREGGVLSAFKFTWTE